jgi:hypothetical protein
MPVRSVQCLARRPTRVGHAERPLRMAGPTRPASAPPSMTQPGSAQHPGCSQVPGSRSSRRCSRAGPDRDRRSPRGAGPRDAPSCGGRPGRRPDPGHGRLGRRPGHDFGGGPGRQRGVAAGSACCLLPRTGMRLPAGRRLALLVALATGAVLLYRLPPGRLVTAATAASARRGRGASVTWCPAAASAAARPLPQDPQPSTAHASRGPGAAAAASLISSDYPGRPRYWCASPAWAASSSTSASCAVPTERASSCSSGPAYGILGGQRDRLVQAPVAGE